MNWHIQKELHLSNNKKIHIDEHSRKFSISMNGNSLLSFKKDEIPDLIKGLQDGLNLFESKENTESNEPKNIVTSVSWSKNTIQLDNNKWIKVDNAKDYHKGDVYNAN